MATIHGASDADLAAALPILEPLMELHGAAGLPWKAVSNRDGFAVAEIPAWPELGLSMPCYRTQFIIHATLDALHRVLSAESAIRQYDSTLKEFRVVEKRRCNTLLYTSYTSPSPWLVAPRDFCVWSSTVLTDAAQLARANAKYADWSSEVLRAPPLPTTASAACIDSEDAAAAAAPLVYLQGSINASPAEASAAMVGRTREKALVRGVIHCYGYVAVCDAAQETATVRVTNYCCVDPAGQIPKWVVAAAVDDNTKKLRKMTALVEAAAAVMASTTETGEEEAKRRHLQASPPAPPPPQTQPTPPSPLSPDACRPEPLSCAAAAPAAAAHTPLSHVPPTPLRPAPLRDDRNASVASTPPRRVRAGASLSPAGASAASTPRRGAPLASVTDADVELLALLARSPGWQVQRELAEVEYAELRSLPESVRCKNPLCVALRVSCSIRCGLDTLAAVLHNAALAPEIDPELVRVFAVPSASSASPTPARSGAASSPRPEAASVQRSGERSAAAEAVTFPSPEVLGGPAATQLRHYQFDATADALTQPWESVLQCAEVELTAQRGGRLGFYTPGLPAATLVWIGTEDSMGCYRGAHPDSSHHTVRVRLFGMAAVAVPRAAATVRVSQYMLFHPDAALPSPRKRGWGSTSRRREASAAAAFLAGVAAWLQGRAVRLRRLGQALQRRHDRSVLLPLDKEPLLRFLYKVHCKQGGAALDSPGATLFDDVLAQSVPWAAAAEGNTQLLVLSTVFPCSLSHLRAFMQATPPRTRYAMECGVASYGELSSPPGLTALRLEYGAASASFPWLRLVFLEAFGELKGKNVPWSTLVLSRTALDGLLDEVQDSEDEDASLGPRRESAELAHGSAGAAAAFATPLEDDRFETGRIVCSGWVATTVDGDAGDAASYTDTPHTGRTPVSLELYSLRSTPDDERSLSPPHQPARVVVMQYLCVERPVTRRGSLDDQGLPTGCAAEQAALLQRFRGAVCAWSGPGTQLQES